MARPIHSPEHDTLGHVVLELRARRRLSQEALGYRADLHRNYVGAIERGEINPTFGVLLKLERGLQIPLSEIIKLAETRRDERPPNMD
jgi:transcriptional regulator with XRE-family HTH domain